MSRRVIVEGSTAGNQLHLQTKEAAPGTKTGTPPSISKRGHRYMDALKRIERVTSETSAHELSALAAEVRESLALDQSSVLPWGLVAACYLGEPYEVHILDLTKEIVQHYPRNKPMPWPFESARPLASRDDYLAIEVYTDHMVCITKEGDAIRI